MNIEKLRNCANATAQNRVAQKRYNEILREIIFAQSAVVSRNNLTQRKQNFAFRSAKIAQKWQGVKWILQAFSQKSFFFLSLKLMQRYLMIQKIHVFKLILICLNKKYVSEANFKNHSFRIYVLWIRKLFVKVYIGPVLFNAQSICLQIRTAVQLIDHQRRCETRKVTVHVNI